MGLQNYKDIVGAYYTLLNEHLSLKNKVYNKKGDKVKVISANSDTWIVENKAGERYAINKSKLI